MVMGASRIETYMFSDTHQKLFKDSFTMIQIYLFGTLCRIKKTSIYTFSILVFTCFKESSCWGMLRPYHDCHGVCVLLGLQLSEEIFGFQTRQQFLCLKKKAGRNKYLMERHQIKTLGYMLGYTLDIGWYWMILIGILACLKLEIVEAAWKCQNVLQRLLLVFGSATSRSNSGPPRSGGKGAVFASFCRAAWQWCFVQCGGWAQKLQTHKSCVLWVWYFEVNYW